MFASLPFSRLLPFISLDKAVLCMCGNCSYAQVLIKLLRIYIPIDIFT